MAHTYTLVTEKHICTYYEYTVQSESPLDESTILGYIQDNNIQGVPQGQTTEERAEYIRSLTEN